METVLHYLTMAGAALFMVFFFGACIFIHELGHFLAARMCGLHISAFSIGFRKIWGKTINGVEYRIGWIPFGGYVDLPQIDASTDEIKDEQGNILPKVAPWKRMVTAFAGPLFNILFGLLLGCVIWIAGLPQESPRMSEFKVRSVEAASPEYAAGLRENDVIVRRNGAAFRQTWGEFARSIMLNVGDTTLTVRRDGKEFDVTYRPAVNRQFAPQEEIPYPFFRPELPVVVFPDAGSPAEKAGLKAGDRVLKISGEELYGADELQTAVLFSQGAALELTVAGDDGAERIVRVLPEPVPGTTDADGAWMTGIMFQPEKELLTIEGTMRGMPAEKLFRHADIVTAVNGVKNPTVEIFRAEIAKVKDSPASVEILRDGKTQTVSLSAVFVRPHRIGVSFRILTHPNPIEQFNDVLVLTWRSLKSVGAGIGRSLGFDAGYTALGAKHLSGPIGIGKYLYVSVYRGSIVLGLNLVVIITFNLGLLNLLPIPVLDGGHILLSLLEMIFRRPVPAKVLQPIAYTFITLLIAFMVFVSFYDIKKLIPMSSNETNAKKTALPAESGMPPPSDAKESPADAK